MSTVFHQKPEVLARIPLDAHASIEASAGTGKTFTLEHLVVEILLQTDARIDQLLLVTFTDRATAELKARIRATLERLLGQSADVGDPTQPGWRIDDAARAKLAAALGALDGATIATLHGFCQRTLAEQAFDSGRLFEETQVDGAQAFHDAFLALVRRELAPQGKDPEALQAWLTHGGDLEALEELLRGCVAERGRLLPAFDPAALQSALQRLASFDLAAVERELNQTTAISNSGSRRKVWRVLQPLLAALPGWLGRTDVITLLCEIDAALAVEDGRGYLGAPLAKAKGTLLPALGQALAALMEATPPLEAAVVGALLPRVRQALVARKRALGQFDFDDMLTLLRDALHGPGGPALTAALRARYRYALVDEFQDTDEVQWEIFQTLFHTRAKPPVLYLVGDPKQAIYGFRGADVHTYLSAREALLAQGGVSVELDHNYRSTAPLLAAVNRILDQGAAQPFFAGPVTYPRPVSCGRPALQLTDGAGQAVAPVELWQVLGAGRLPVNAALSGLAQAIARDVQRLADPAGPGMFLAGRRLGPGDVFVLTRTASEGRLVGQALRDAGVPVAFFKQDGLLQSPEAHAVRDLLAAIAHPEDLSALRQAWLTPFFGLTLEALSAQADVSPTHPLRARIHGWKALADAQDYERLFPRILEESGLARRALFQGGAERALTNVQHLFELLLGEVHRARGPLTELVRTLSAYIRERRLPPGADGNLQRLETDAQAVQVMTLHKSKGLEAPLVYLFGGLSRSPPRKLSPFHDGQRRCAWVGKVPRDSALAARLQQEAAEEHQRLLYVGLTRAAGRLVLPYFGPLDDGDAAAFTAREGAPPVTQPRQLGGVYAVLNARLVAMDAEGALVPEAGFSRQQVICGRSASPVPAQAQAPSGWTPPAELLAPATPEVRVEQLRRAHAGFFVTSYTRMAAGEKGQVSEVDSALFKADADQRWVELPEGELPPGAETGIFLHALLERLPLLPARRATDPASFCALPEVAAVLERVARAHGVGPRARDQAGRLCFHALCRPIALPGGARLPAIASAARVLREVEFLYPVPEAHHPRLDAPGERPFRIERGCIKGFVDLIVEDGGRTYFADWKSDLLAAYDPPALAARVAERYALQERLYTLALLRMLQVTSAADYQARCGGSLYLFLRGLPEGGGVHASRPTWEQVVAWEAELRARDDFGVAV